MSHDFSQSTMLSRQFIHVLSRIPRLAECIKAVVIPQFEVKNINVADSNDIDTTVEDCFPKEALKNVQILVCDSDLLIENYKYMHQLKWAHSTWAGVETILKAIPEQPSFTLTRHSGEAFSTLIAEYVLCHILNFERSSKLYWKNQESKIWVSDEQLKNYRTLGEISVSILGVGNMATGIAHFLKSRGTTVYGFARIARSPGECPHFDHVYTKLDDVLPVCDYLINTLPSTPHTNGILNNSILKSCAKKPVFINVGRANIISEEEIVTAISNKWLSGAVLDVFEKEPLPQSSKLWSMPEVVITPHIAAVSKPEHIAEEFSDNVIRYLDGHGLMNIVNWKTGY